MPRFSIKLYDKNFIQCGPSVSTGPTGKKPKCIEWYTGDDYRYMAVYTDQCLDMIKTHKEKHLVNIAWLIEPSSLIQETYKKIKTKEYFDLFDAIIIHEYSDPWFRSQVWRNNSLELKPSKIKYVPFGGHWLKDEDIKLPEKITNKTKFISAIFSEKNILPGHKIRHYIYEETKKAEKSKNFEGLFTLKGHIYGNISGNLIANKIEALRDYKFHVVIEDDQKFGWFTEKLIDPILAGCIPVYWGCQPKIIREMFDYRGIIFLKNGEHLGKLIHTARPGQTISNLQRGLISNKYYENAFKLGVLKNNFELAKQYLYTEDTIYEKVIKDLMM